MELPDIKKLEEIIALCRKRGVSRFRMGDMEFDLGDEPKKRPYVKKNEAEFQEEEEFTQDQLLFYSAVPTGPQIGESEPE